jgi:hypothetical protein
VSSNHPDLQVVISRSDNGAAIRQCISFGVWPIVADNLFDSTSAWIKRVSDVAARRFSNGVDFDLCSREPEMRHYVRGEGEVLVALVCRN